MQKTEVTAYLLLAAYMLFMMRAIDCADKARILGAIHKYTLTGGCQIKELLLFNE